MVDAVERFAVVDETELDFFVPFSSHFHQPSDVWDVVSGASLLI